MRATDNGQNVNLAEGKLKVLRQHDRIRRRRAQKMKRMIALFLLLLCLPQFAFSAQDMDQQAGEAVAAVCKRAAYQAALQLARVELTADPSLPHWTIRRLWDTEILYWDQFAYHWGDREDAMYYHMDYICESVDVEHWPMVPYKIATDREHPFISALRPCPECVLKCDNWHSSNIQRYVKE